MSAVHLLSASIGHSGRPLWVPNLRRIFCCVVPPLPPHSRSLPFSVLQLSPSARCLLDIFLLECKVLRAGLSVTFMARVYCSVYLKATGWLIMFRKDYLGSVEASWVLTSYSCRWTACVLCLSSFPSKTHLKETTQDVLKGFYAWMWVTFLWRTV